MKNKILGYRIRPCENGPFQIAKSIGDLVLSFRDARFLGVRLPVIETVREGDDDCNFFGDHPESLE